MNQRNQRSLNLDQDSRINHQNEQEINFQKIKSPTTEIEIDSNYNSKLNSKAIRRKIKMKHDL